MNRDEVLNIIHKKVKSKQDHIRHWMENTEITQKKYDMYDVLAEIHNYRVLLESIGEIQPKIQRVREIEDELWNTLGTTILD